MYDANVQQFHMYENAPEKLSVNARETLARHAIRQGATEIAGIYKLPVDVVRDIVTQYRATLVRRRKGES